MKKTLLVALVAVVLTSCYTTTYYVEGKYQLADTNSNYETNNATMGNGMYSDEYITISPVVSDPKIDLTIVNNYKSSIRVLWDEAALIDGSGATHRVIHMGVKLVDKEKAQVPSVIPSGARIEDVVAPVDALEFVNGEWSITSFYDKSFATKEDAEDLLNRYESTPSYTSSKLLLPIEVEGKKIEYTFTFVGDNFELQSFETYDDAKSNLAIYGWSTIITTILCVVAAGL